MESDSFVMVFLLMYLSPLILLITYLIIYFVRKLRFKIDYSNSNFKCISGLVFMKYCKLPKDRDFFKNTLYNIDAILPTVLPIIDMNDYDFTNVPISNCFFSKKTILPKDPEFFQKIKNKEVYNCRLPNGDYSFYNFKGVYLNSVSFPKKSKIPTNYTFFRDLGNSYITRLSLPKSFRKTCHLYDFSKTNAYCWKKIKISDEQKEFIKLKNNGILYSFIKHKPNKKVKLKRNIFILSLNIFPKKELKV